MYKIKNVGIGPYNISINLCKKNGLPMGAPANSYREFFILLFYVSDDMI